MPQYCIFNILPNNKKEGHCISAPLNKKRVCYRKDCMYNQTFPAGASSSAKKNLYAAVRICSSDIIVDMSE